MQGLPASLVQLHDEFCALALLVLQLPIQTPHAMPQHINGI